jgi:hypothetical protein
MPVPWHINKIGGSSTTPRSGKRINGGADRYNGGSAAEIDGFVYVSVFISASAAAAHRRLCGEMRCAANRAFRIVWRR